MNKHIKGISDEVMNFFNAYDWWGNVRELKNVIECAFNFAQSDVIQLEDIDCYEDEIKAVERRAWFSNCLLYTSEKISFDAAAKIAINDAGFGFYEPRIIRIRGKQPIFTGLTLNTRAELRIK